MEVIQITDFSGGINARDGAIFLKDNQCTVSSLNVWAPNGYLTKAPGNLTVMAPTATSTGCFGIKATNLGASGSTRLFAILASAGSTVSASLWYTDTVSDLWTPLGYTTGTVSVSGASLISATGNGTTWTTHVLGSDYFRINATAASWFRIASVEDNTHLTLANALPVAVATGTAYTALTRIIPTIANIRSITSMEVLNGSLWISNNGDGANTVFQYDGTGLLNVTAAPAAPVYMRAHKGYLFAASYGANTSRIRWSTKGTGNTWPTNNFEDVDIANNGFITGMISYGNELIVFKQTGMYSVVGDIFNPSSPTYAIYPITVPGNFFFNGNNSPVIHNGVLYFTTSDGLYQYTQGSGYIKKTSQTYNKVFLSDTSFINTLVTGNAHQNNFGMSYRDNLWLYHSFTSFGTSAAETNFGGFTLIDHNGAFWKFQDTTDSEEMPHQLGIFRVQGGRSVLVGVNHVNSRVSEINSSAESGNTTTYTYDGASKGIDSQWESKQFAVKYGTFKNIYIYFQKQTAGNLTVQWSIDRATYVSENLDMSLGKGSVIKRVLNVNQKGSTIQLRIKHSTSGQTFEVYKIEVTHEPDLAARIA